MRIPMMKKLLVGAIPVFILLLAAWIRGRLIFQHDWLPGVNGGYYPLMVRGLIENGSLPFSDFPLVFWLLAGLTYAAEWLGVSSETAPLLAVQLADTFLPALVAIPAWRLTRFAGLSAWQAGVITAFTTLLFPSTYLMTGDMLKNGLGMVWLMAYFHYLFRFSQIPCKSHLAGTLVYLILLALTHFGSLLTGFLALPVLLVSLRKWLFSRMPAVSLLVFAPLLLTAPDAATRWLRFLSVSLNPLRLFEHPVLLYQMNGQTLFTPFITGYTWIIHLLAVTVLLMALKRRTGIWWALMALFLSSPLLGVEWYLRLAMMAHAPLAVAIVLTAQKRPDRPDNTLNSVLAIAALVSVFLGFTGKKVPAMSPDEFRDMQEIKSRQLVQDGDLVMAAHGLEWWSGWVLETPIAQQQAVMADDTARYNRILGIRRSHTAHQGMRRGQLNFRDPDQTLVDSVLYAGSHLVLFEAHHERFKYMDRRRAPVSGGLIRPDAAGRIWLQSELYANPLIINRYMKKTLLSWPPEEPVLVYGRKRAFSLQILVDSISGAPPGS